MWHDLTNNRTYLWINVQRHSLALVNNSNNNHSHSYNAGEMRQAQFLDKFRAEEYLKHIRMSLAAPPSPRWDVWVERRSNTPSSPPEPRLINSTGFLIMETSALILLKQDLTKNSLKRRSEQLAKLKWKTNFLCKWPKIPLIKGL